MISELKVIGYCREDIKNIENYEKAVADDSCTWVCHHRTEIDLGLSSEQLIRKHLYYERPASELIFLTPGEHSRLHNLHLTDERRSNLLNGIKQYHATHECPQSTRDKISQYLKDQYANGRMPWNKGKKGMKGYPHTEETKKRLSEKAKKRWANPEFKQKMLDKRWPK